MAYRLMICLALLLIIAGCDSPRAARRTPAPTTTVAPTDTVRLANACGTNASAAKPSGNVAHDYKCYWSVAVPANLALVKCAELQRARAALLDDHRIDSQHFGPVPDPLLTSVEKEVRRRCD